VKIREAVEEKEIRKDAEKSENERRRAWRRVTTRDEKSENERRCGDELK
jgi:hypothetical protein